MHFSIPDTQQLLDDSGSKYTGYNLHLNGTFHSTVRFKQLHYFNEQLIRAYGAENVPIFPPKKLFRLTSMQIDERRVQLEKYMQSLGQSSILRTSELVISFLCAAQQETYGEKVVHANLAIYQMNGVQINISINSDDSYSTVLEKVCIELSLPQTYIYYFALYLVCTDDDQFKIRRKLQNYESPYIALKTHPESLRMYLMKSYWDIDYDIELMRDAVGLNLLYAQALADIKAGRIIVHKDTRRILDQLESSGAKKEYVELARKSKYYGFIEFEPCICDFPKPNTNVIVNMGMREINCRIQSSEGEIREGTFKVTRMRCWRVTNKKEELSDNISNHNDHTYRTVNELAFEYLLAKDKLQWITISSSQAILMSNLLQSIIDELLLKRNNDCEDRPERNLSRSSSFYYMKRDGSSQITSPSISSTELDSNSSNGSNDSRSMSVRRLSDKFSSVSMKTIGKSPFVENDAFEGIGDDDL